MKNLSFRNKNFNISLIIALALIIGSCKKEDCKPHYQLPGGGGSAIVNGSYIEFGAGYGIEANGKHSLFLDNAVWFENTVWALRNRIDIQNLELNLKDPMTLNHQLLGRATILSAYFSTIREDGDLSGECYELLETKDFPNWIVITEHHEGVEIAGSLQAAFIISNECPQKDDPADPDTIYVNNCNFRAINIH